MPMARRNLLAGLVLTVVGLGYGYLTVQLPDRGIPGTPGPAFFPTLITVGWLVLSLSLLVRGFLDSRKDTADVAAGGSRDFSALIALAAFLIYIVALPRIGFVAASIVFFALLMWLYGERNKVIIGLTAVVVPVALFFLFTAGFQILLPRGPW